MTHNLVTLLRDLKTLGWKRMKALVDVTMHAKRRRPLNDKEYLMEYVIQAAACLPDDFVRKRITENFVTTLWNDELHAPPSHVLLGDDFNFRQPDGSRNNCLFPHIGAAGMPYARTVTPTTVGLDVLPDPGVLFDTLMKREAPEEHPSKISSMLFYLASIIIHDCFKTNGHDYNISDTSSYLDLEPLYGGDWKHQKLMRTFKDGKIKPDCFSESRLLQFPPGAGALLIMFNRYHNYVVDQLATIKEGGRFTETGAKVDRYGESSLDKRDDDLFQTGRLITCGLYVNIILSDYVRTILNLNRTDSNWQLDPRIDIPGVPRGTGNQVSCEFNLVYRWHASVSARDEAWTKKLFQQVFETGPGPVDLTSEDDLKALSKLAEIKKTIPEEPQERSWPALESEVLKRDESGRYNDHELAAILTSSIEDCANATGPRRIPAVMKFISTLGITQARTWGLATLNEFRSHFGLEPHRTFQSITRDKEAAKALERLYRHPDNVELYPGLVVEDAKRPMVPGSGLCPGYTISRAVLSDAVGLVRGDRFYTTSYSPNTLTSWGYKDVATDPAIDNGCVFYKLFKRALPQSYDDRSVYVHYPLTVPHGPNGMKEVLEKLGKAKMYNFDIPASSVRSEKGS